MAKIVGKGHQLEEEYYAIERERAEKLPPRLLQHSRIVIPFFRML